MRRSTAFLTTTLVVTSIGGYASLSYSQAGYHAGQPSFDCAIVTNTVAFVLCTVPEAAQADWELNSASWALYFTVNETRRRVLDQEQQAWRQSLDRMCVLPHYQTPQDQAGQAMAETIGRMMLGPGVRLPGPQPLTQAHVTCVLNAYHARAAMLRSKLTGDALAESRLSPEQHAELQVALAERRFLRPDQVGAGTHDGEFGPITRKAINQFQQSLDAAPTGFLSDDQRSALLEHPGEREARAVAHEKEVRDAEAADAKAREDAARYAMAKEKVETERQAAQEKAERDRLDRQALQREAQEKADRDRREAEAQAAKQWRLKIDRAHVLGEQSATKSELKWSLSETDNPMTDDKDYTVASAQPNGTGAIAKVEGSCPKPGRVTFVAVLTEVSGQTPLGLPDSGAGYIAGYKRLNDDPPQPVHFEMQKYRNRILLSTLVSLDPLESIEATWLVRAQIETARGRMDIQIPMFNASVQKLLVACGRQYENAKSRGGLPDAPQ
jgi:peptidoglycan hydrolase-like protein with peptidoglycan-binding domain